MFIIITNKCTIITKIYITTVSLYNLHSYTFRPCQFYNQCLAKLHKLFKLQLLTISCFSDRASWIDYILITNLMHWLLFIHKILFSSICFEPQVPIFRRIQLYTCNIWYCHSVREFLVASRNTAWVLTQAVYRQATRNSLREWQYHMLHVYNCILLKWALEARNM